MCCLGDMFFLPTIVLIYYHLEIPYIRSLEVLLFAESEKIRTVQLLYSLNVIVFDEYFLA